MLKSTLYLRIQVTLSSNHQHQHFRERLHSKCAVQNIYKLLMINILRSKKSYWRNTTILIDMQVERERETLHELRDDPIPILFSTWWNGLKITLRSYMNYSRWLGGVKSSKIEHVFEITSSVMQKSENNAKTRFNFLPAHNLLKKIRKCMANTSIASKENNNDLKQNV